MPSVLERLYLRFAGGARGLAKENIVGTVGVERRVQVDEVYRLVRKVFAVPEDVQVIAVVEDVGVHCGEILPRRAAVARPTSGSCGWRW